jgi:MFS family permease
MPGTEPAVRIGGGVLRRLWPYGRLTHIPQGITVVLMGFLPIFAIVSMFPAVPSLIGHFAGNPNAVWEVPLMVTAPGLSIALLSPFAGLLADKFGRRSSLIWATLAYGVLGTLPVFLQSLSIIFACRLGLGVTEAFILTGVNALIGDYWNDRERRAWLSIQGIIGPFLSVGVILASGSITKVMWNGAFLIYLVGFPIFFATRAYLFEPTKDGATAAELSRRGDVPPFPWPAVLLTGTVTFLMSILYYVFIINGGLLFKEAGIVSSDRLSQLTALPSLFVIAGAYLFWMMRGAANAVQLAVSFLALGAGLALMGLLADYRLALIALTIQQVGAGMSVPALIAWTQTKLPFEHRGRGMGAWSTCFFLGQFCSPWFVHQLSTATGSMHGAFICAGIFGVAAAIVSLVAAERGGAKRQEGLLF